MSKYDEKVLCLNKKLLTTKSDELVILGLGFGSPKKAGAIMVADAASTDLMDIAKFVTRRDAGDDPDFPIDANELEYIQIIPYIVVIDKDNQNVLMGIRSEDPTEKRLASKLALGLGGHINEKDFAPGDSFADVLIKAAQREIKEELVGAEKTKIGFYPWFDSEDKKKDFYVLFYEGNEKVSTFHMGILMFAVIEEKNGKLDFAEGQKLVELFPDFLPEHQIDIQDTINKIQPGFPSVDFEKEYALAYNYLVLNNVEEALELFRTSNPDVVPEGWALFAAAILSKLPNQLEQIRTFSKLNQMVKKLKI
jgi:predicted NUDIX family phosphoesterase